MYSLICPRTAILVRPLIWTYWIAFSYCLGRYLVIASGGSYRWLSASNNGYGSSRDDIVRSSFTLQENNILGLWRAATSAQRRAATSKARAVSSGSAHPTQRSGNSKSSS